MAMRHYNQPRKVPKRGISAVRVGGYPDCQLAAGSEQAELGRKAAHKHVLPPGYDLQATVIGRMVVPPLSMNKQV
jgi:hypothetical protein